jgi:hypothetical protein
MRLLQIGGGLAGGTLALKFVPAPLIVVGVFLALSYLTVRALLRIGHWFADKISDIELPALPIPSFYPSTRMAEIMTMADQRILGLKHELASAEERAGDLEAECDRFATGKQSEAGGKSIPRAPHPRRRIPALWEQNVPPSVGRRFPPIEGIGMPFLPLRLAPLVLAATVALSGTATASVLVTVNKATQRMTVLVDGETRYSWPVSTGMKGYATPAGTFRPFRLEEEHYSKEWDDAPMPHSIFFTQAGHAIHGSNATRRLGSPASHGCIRIAPANAAKLFALVSAEGLSNTKVVVTGGQVGRVARRQTPQARPPRIRPEPDFGEAAYGGPYYRYHATPASIW